MSTMFATRLDTSTLLSKDKHPVVLQVTFDRKVRRKRLGISCTRDQWDFDTHEIKKGVHGRREDNKKIEECEERAAEIYRKNFKNRPFNYKKFSQLFNGKPQEEIGVIEFAEKLSKELLTLKRGASSHDYKNIASAIRKVSPNDIAFSDITEEWLENFEHYFTSRGCKCFSYMKILRSLYNKAVKKRLVDFKLNPFLSPFNPYGYSFGKLRKRKSEKTNDLRIKDLPLEYMKQILAYTPVSDLEQKYLDVWLFSYYTFGVNLIDIALMQRHHIREGRWYYERSKTGVGLKKGKPLLKEALEIIKRRDTGGKYIFDILNGYDQDEKAKEKRLGIYRGRIRKAAIRISKRLGFNGYFTYYSARHTSATIALNKNADKNTVSHLLDHENFTTINNYAGRADDEKIIAAMNLLRL